MKIKLNLIQWVSRVCTQIRNKTFNPCDIAQDNDVANFINRVKEVEAKPKQGRKKINKLNENSNSENEVEDFKFNRENNYLGSLEFSKEGKDEYFKENFEMPGLKIEEISEHSRINLNNLVQDFSNIKLTDKKKKI